MSREPSRPLNGWFRNQSLTLACSALPKRKRSTSCAGFFSRPKIPADTVVPLTHMYFFLKQDTVSNRSSNTGRHPSVYFPADVEPDLTHQDMQARPFSPRSFQPDENLPHEGISRSGDGTQKDSGDGELHDYYLLAPGGTNCIRYRQQRQDQPHSRRKHAKARRQRWS